MKYQKALGDPATKSGTQLNAHSASEANQVAQETLSISKKIIEQADAKEFDGKDTIRV
ncbi:hypothetical protein [Aliarcobacter butzleri]|uniref:hypothetical protein n=1 Tax=Aliarcobacter butzleri TaxID=28197 RepID=UPI0021B32914|nr:hypothetical protein [Aliarcobacter butzleri]MCT7557911.1 hypothetical protein [Aliarcobacter butzleri]